MGKSLPMFPNGRKARVCDRCHALQNGARFDCRKCGGTRTRRTVIFNAPKGFANAA